MSRTLIASLALLSLTAPAHAQDFPNRPMTMVVPFAAGGGVDVLGRTLAARAAEILGQQIVIENVAGAGGMTGASRIAKAAPDGYQFVLGSVGTHAQNQWLYKQPAYNAVKDFEPVILVGSTPLVLVTRPDFPASNLQEFIAYAKAHPGELKFGSAGVSSAIHLGCVLFNGATGIQAIHIPYRGGGPAMQDLVAGRIDYNCQIITSASPQVRDKQVKAPALLGRARTVVARPRHRAGAGSGRVRRWKLEYRFPAQGHAGTHRPQAQRSPQRGDGFTGNHKALARHRHRYSGPGPPEPGLCGKILRAGDQEIRSADQGQRHRHRINLFPARHSTA